MNKEEKKIPNRMDQMDKEYTLYITTLNTDGIFSRILSAVEAYHITITRLILLEHPADNNLFNLHMQIIASSLLIENLKRQIEKFTEVQKIKYNTVI